MAFTQESVAGTDSVVAVGAAVAAEPAVAVVDGVIATESPDGIVSAVGTDCALPDVSTVAAGRVLPDAPHPVANRQSADARARRREVAAGDMARHHTACLSTLDFWTATAAESNHSVPN